jgi:hypothetical protein
VGRTLTSKQPLGHHRPIGGDRDHLRERAGRRAQGPASGPRPEPKPANVAPAANAAGSLGSAAPSRSCPRSEPTWRRPRSHPAASGTADHAALQDLPALTVASPGRPVDGPAPRRVGPSPCGSGGPGVLAVPVVLGLGRQPRRPSVQGPERPGAVPNGTVGRSGEPADPWRLAAWDLGVTGAGDQPAVPPAGGGGPTGRRAARRPPLSL